MVDKNFVLKAIMNDLYYRGGRVVGVGGPVDNLKDRFIHVVYFRITRSNGKLFTFVPLSEIEESDFEPIGESN